LLSGDPGAVKVATPPATLSSKQPEP